MFVQVKARNVWDVLLRHSVYQLYCWRLWRLCSVRQSLRVCVCAVLRSVRPLSTSHMLLSLKGQMFDQTD